MPGVDAGLVQNRRPANPPRASQGTVSGFGGLFGFPWCLGVPSVSRPPCTVHLTHGKVHSPACAADCSMYGTRRTNLGACIHAQGLGVSPWARFGLCLCLCMAKYGHLDTSMAQAVTCDSALSCIVLACHPLITNATMTWKPVRKYCMYLATCRNESWKVF